MKEPNRKPQPASLKQPTPKLQTLNLKPEIPALALWFRVRDFGFRVEGHRVSGSGLGIYKG